MKKEPTYLGLDGEGVGGHSVDEPNHKYILLAAVSEDGKKRYHVENPKGLSTTECLHFLISLPENSKVYTYSFNYDLTKLLQDLDNQRLYLLFRPEKRPGPDSRKGPRPIFWNGFSLNLQGTKFTLEYDSRKLVIWDIWKFYQSKFVGALEDWKVGSPALWERMSKMKAQRGTFDLSELDAIRNYCFEECQCMAFLAHDLTRAHDAAGLKLTSFYGAGSSGGAMLKKMGILEKIVPVPEEMELAVSQAFFGGRF